MFKVFLVCVFKHNKLTNNFTNRIYNKKYKPSLNFTLWQFYIPKYKYSFCFCTINNEYDKGRWWENVSHFWLFGNNVIVETINILDK